MVMRPKNDGGPMKKFLVGLGLMAVTTAALAATDVLSFCDVCPFC
jgi:hypothetical protein